MDVTGYFGKYVRADRTKQDARPLQSHCRGQGFDSPQLHQPFSYLGSQAYHSHCAHGGQSLIDCVR